jgi:hypothetical protein
MESFDKIWGIPRDERNCMQGVYYSLQSLDNSGLFSLFIS